MDISDRDPLSNSPPATPPQLRTPVNQRNSRGNLGSQTPSPNSSERISAISSRSLSQLTDLLSPNRRSVQRRDIQRGGTPQVTRADDQNATLADSPSAAPRHQRPNAREDSFFSRWNSDIFFDDEDGDDINQEPVTLGPNHVRIEDANMDLGEEAIDEYAEENMVYLNPNLVSGAEKRFTPFENDEDLSTLIFKLQEMAKTYDPNNYDLDFLTTANESEPESLAADQKEAIRVWLYRLSLTQDFQLNNERLVLTTCSILESIQKNVPFREAFFEQLLANQEGCDDRSAETFNIIYSLWRLHELPPNTPLLGKLQLLAGIVKTITLRDVIASKIRASYGEQVEVILYYENLLKDELQLVSFIQTTHYVPSPELEDNPDFEINVLIKEVLDNYKKSLVFLSAFKEVAGQDEAYKAERESIGEPIINIANALDLVKEELLTGTYLNTMNRIMSEHEKILEAYDIHWVSGYLDEDAVIPTPFIYEDSYLTSLEKLLKNASVMGSSDLAKQLDALLE